MANAPVKKPLEVHEDTGFVLRWGKFATKVAAIGATVTGAFAALFSSSSITGGITLTAVGASTLAAAEKLPDPRYIKTKHIPPLPGRKRASKALLAPDILPKPEKIVSSKKLTPSSKSLSKEPLSIARMSPSYERNNS